MAHCFGNLFKRRSLSLATMTLLLLPAAVPVMLPVEVAIAQTANPRQQEADKLLQQGIKQLNVSQFREALQSFQQAQKLYRQLGNRYYEGYSTLLIGRTHSALSQYPEAIAAYQEAAPIFHEVGELKAEAVVIDNIGVIYSKQGSYAQALQFHQKAVVLFRQVESLADEGIALVNVANVYSQLGQYSQSLKIQEQALKAFQQLGDRFHEAITLDNMAVIYVELRQYQRALAPRQKALEIFKELGRRSDEAITLSNLAFIYGKLGQSDKALAMFQQALTIKKEVGDRIGQGIVLSNIAGIYEDAKQYDKALTLYQQTVAIAREVGDRSTEGSNLANVGRVQLFLNQPSAAERVLYEAVKVQESLRAGLSDENKVSLFDTRALVTYIYLQTALIAQQKTDAALEVAERGRARAFVELLASRLKKTGNQGQEAIAPPNLQQIKQIAKQQNATLVQYSVIFGPTNRAIYIWVIKPTGEVSFHQSSLANLDVPLTDLVLSGREEIGVRNRSGIKIVPRDPKRSRDAKNQLQELYDLLIRPIANQLPTDPNQRVVFIPANALFLVPFAALQDTKDTYLIDRHTISVAPSIQVLELTQKVRREERGARSQKTYSSLVVGNPTMPSLSPAPGEPSEQLAALPGAEREALAIAKLLNTKPMLGSQATETEVRQKMAQASIIHLATHGILDDVRGLGSSIALAPGGKNDGFLTAEEILDLKLQADLVVLSACDTGRGKITGDGVIGLSRSLISAGTPSVIVSLWAVPDAPTAALMVEFYQNLQKNPDKAQALRQAMLVTKQQHPNPRDWAAFTLIGEP